MSEKTNPSNKDVIYIDVDDEITGIIDKVRGSHSKIVALVLPKRATTLQSVVNMKLLKRSADESKKNLVLITSEPGLMPLAGGVGMFVAKTLQSKPEIPDEPLHPDSRPDLVDEDDIIQDDTPEQTVNLQADGARPVGELAGAAAAPPQGRGPNPAAGMDDTIDLSDDEIAEETSASGAVLGKSGKPGKPKDKKLAVPDFNKFRLAIIIAGVGVVALVIFGYFALAVMPKATVTIKTNSQSLTSSSVVTLKTGDAVTLDTGESIVPAKVQQTQKTLTQQVDASGQQNNGEKATGMVNVKNCTDDPVTLPTGTAMTTAGVTFITSTPLSLGAGNFSSGGTCRSTGSHIDSVTVIAQNPGTKYNVGASAFTIPGLSSKITASSTNAMSGGTDDIKKIVTQADIDSATQKIGSQNSDTIKDQLKSDLVTKGYFPVIETFASTTPDTKTSVNAGDAADTVTVTQAITYSMFGAHESDLKKIVEADVNKKIDPKKQSILDFGLNEAVFGLQSAPDGSATITMQTTVIAGPDLKTADIKKQVAGKKANSAREAVKQNPGVTDVEVHYSPFWVNAIPKKESKITVTIEKPAASSNSTNADDN